MQSIPFSLALFPYFGHTPSFTLYIVRSVLSFTRVSSTDNKYLSNVLEVNIDISYPYVEICKAASESPSIRHTEQLLGDGVLNYASGPESVPSKADES